MILFFNLCVSFILNFGSFYIGDYNLIYQNQLDSCKSFMRSQGGWQSSYGNVSDEYFIGQLSNGNIIFYFPREVAESSFSSSCSVSSSSDYGFTCFFTQWVQITWNGSSCSYVWLDNSSSYRSFTYPNSSNGVSGDIVFSGSDSFYYNGDYLITVNPPPSSPIVEGHSSGWGNTLEEVNGVYYTVLGHSDISNSDSFDLVNSSSSITDKLLKAIGRINAGMSDNISFGLGTLISLFNRGLDVIGLDGVSSVLSDIYDIISGTSDSVTNIDNNVSDYIAWVSEPFDAAEFDLALQNSGFDNYSSLANNIKQTLDMARVDSSHVFITLDLSNIAYFSSFGSQTFDLASYLNGSKNIWQPILLTFIYATIFWGFFRSVPNIIGGASPLANSVEGVKNNAK